MNQATKRRLQFRTSKGEESHTGYAVGLQLIDEATNEVAWERSGYVRRLGPMRYDNSIMRKHRSELLTYLRQHPEVELCDREIFPSA
jgi:hypothetical protein